MPLLKLLGLLLMPLLHLLPSCFIAVLLRHLLVLFLLLLLELLSLLTLLLLQLLLLSLILLIQFRVPSIGSCWAIYWWKLVGVYRIGATSFRGVRLIRCSIRRRMVWPSGFTRGHRTSSTELPGSSGGGDWRFAVICGGAQLG